MKAYVYASGIRVSPLNDPVAQTLIRNRTLEWHQAEALGQAGFTVRRIQSLDEIDEPSGLLLSDHVFVSAELIRKFHAAAAARQGISALALTACGFTEFTTPIQDVITETGDDSSTVVYQIYWFNNAKPSKADLKSAAPIPIRIKERRLGMERVERVTEGRATLAYYVTREFAFHINHWSHILFANVYAIYHYWSQPSMWRRFLWGFLRAHSLNKWRIMGKLVFKGKNCDIHPSAVVEASVLGNGVKIGRHAEVFGSWLGDDVEIGAGSKISGSVLGDRAVAANDGQIVYCVLYPRAIGGYPGIQGCVLGREAKMTYGTIFIDMKLGKDITVDYRGQRVSTKKQFLGSCLGHNVFVGTGLWFEPGLEIPNGYIIVRDPDKIVREVPQDLPPGVPLIARGSTLIPRPKKVEK